ncbi:hypothetical protein ACIQHY_12925 [Streptomyces sp. NPDC092359]|uniref:hypothetical protein n=1 Tax=Streptomyces sp. NPDC092359 TaxID=3366014 RepID=UPI0037F219E2
MNHDNPLITIEQEGWQITARTSPSSPASFEDPKRDRGYNYLTVPLRQLGLEVTVEYGLSDYVVDVALPDGSSMIISPPQEPPSKDPGFPESWTVVRHREAGPPVYEVVYDSEPDGPDAPYGGSTESLLAAVDARLDRLGVPPRPVENRSPQARAADTVLRQAGFVVDLSPDGERYHRLPKIMADPFEQRQAVTRAFNALQDGGFNVLCESSLLVPGSLLAALRGTHLDDGLAAHTGPVRNPVARPLRHPPFLPG